VCAGEGYSEETLLEALTDAPRQRKHLLRAALGGSFHWLVLRALRLTGRLRGPIVGIALIEQPGDIVAAEIPLLDMRVESSPMPVLYGSSESHIASLVEAFPE
jgi:hypothetical protein